MNLPESGKIVIANIEHCTGGYKNTAELAAVDESDVSLRWY